MEHTTIEVQVNYDGCTSEQDRAKVRVQAKHEIRRKLAVHDELLAALEEIFSMDSPRSAIHIAKDILDKTKETKP